MTLVALAAALAGVLSASPAQAQRERDFVASYGNDSNPCSFTQPCRTFQAAVNAVLPGGEITAIDSAGFGAIVINKAVTITSPPGVEASIAPIANTTAIQITAGSSDLVALRGLTLEGAATGRTGVIFDTGGGLEISNCIIRNFTDTGIFVDAPGQTRILIKDTLISDNPTAGVNIQPTSPNNVAPATNVTIDHTTVFNNGYGIYLGGNPGGNSIISAKISNSTITDSLTTGILGINNGNTDFVTAIIRDTTISEASNTGLSTVGISVSGSRTAFFISHVSISVNQTDVSINNGGFVYTAGNNDLLGAFSQVSGGSLTPAPQQ